jgi:hypothetical protein
MILMQPDGERPLPIIPLSLCHLLRQVITGRQASISGDPWSEFVNRVHRAQETNAQSGYAFPARRSPVNTTAGKLFTDRSNSPSRSLRI